LQFFPLISSWYHLNHVGVGGAWQVSGIANEWDQDVALKVALGVPGNVFRRAGTLLKMVQEGR